MRQFIYSFLVALILPITCFAGIGDKDERFYVTDEMWATEPYKKFVLLATLVSKDNWVGACTAQYVSPNLILSAGHCVKDGAEYKARNYNQKWFDVELLDKEWSTIGENDWAVFLVKDSQNYGDSYFNVSSLNGSENFVPVLHAGYGFLRIIKDDELEKIKKFIKKVNMKYFLQFKFRGATTQELVAELQNSNLGIAPLAEEFPPRLKASNCQLVLTDCSQRGSGCSSVHRALRRSKNYPNIIATTCDSMQGDSGGAYVGNNGFGSLHAVVSYGSNAAASAFDDNREFSYASSALQFKNKIAELIRKYPATYTSVDLADVDETEDVQVDAEVIQGHMEELQQRNDELASRELPADSEQITDNTVLQVINAMVEHQVNQESIEKLQKAYEEAKEREQSLANRTLTALTVAATGIGGMELARGLAEQKADKEAEQDMEAYIATMRCTYGDGKSVKAGTTEIELPGANDPEMMKLRNEYFALAASLKERKEALGMAPGIESEVVFDKVAAGLYDDESTGITGGAYASLYRAKMGSETDQSKIDEDKDASKKRVIAGGVLTGVGVVGGAVGNSLINGKLGEMIKDKKDKKSNSKSNQSVIDKLRKGLKSTGMTNVDKLDFSGLDLSSMSGAIDKIDFSSMSGLSGKNALDVLNTSNGSSFTSSFSNILGGQSF